MGLVLYTNRYYVRSESENSNSWLQQVALGLTKRPMGQQQVTLDA